MIGPTRPTLTTLNDLTRRYQDEVYTLAYYLLGDERQAVQVTQDAFIQVYRPDVLVERFRLEALRQVFACCRGQQPRAFSATDDLFNGLVSLSREEQAAVILVDVLGLNYDQACWVLGRNAKQILKLLAQGRLRLSEITQ